MKTITITAYDHDSTKFIGQEISITDTEDMLKERNEFLESVSFRKWHYEITTTEQLEPEEIKILNESGLDIDGF